MSSKCDEVTDNILLIVIILTRILLGGIKNERYKCKRFRGTYR